MAHLKSLLVLINYRDETDRYLEELGAELYNLVVLRLARRASEVVEGIQVSREASKDSKDTTSWILRSASALVSARVTLRT